MRPAVRRATAANDTTNSTVPRDKKAGAANAPVTRTSTYAPGGLRDALVVEGRKMFEENGASELSLRALARRVGVSEAAPSKHFQGKEELLAAIASNGFRELAAQREMLGEIGDLDDWWFAGARLAHAVLSRS